MNNERYQEIIDEAYENYKMAIQNQRDLQRKEVQRLRSQRKWVRFSHIELLSKEEFINKCKTDIEFSERWGLKIEEKKSTWEEQVQWVMKNTDVECENLYIVEEIAKETTPKRLLTVTYKDEKIEVYE